MAAFLVTIAIKQHAALTGIPKHCRARRVTIAIK
jgi:hypothetical protein